MKINSIWALPVLVLLAGCAVQPTITESDYSKTAPDGYTAVSICYSASDSTKAEIEAVALEECPSTANALEPWDQGNILNDCPMMKKDRVTFLCVIR